MYKALFSFELNKTISAFLIINFVVFKSKLWLAILTTDSNLKRFNFFISTLIKLGVGKVVIKYFGLNFKITFTNLKKVERSFLTKDSTLSILFVFAT